MAAALALAFVPAAALATDAPLSPTTDVCNEAENSWQGDYVVTDTPDPNPPAFLRGEQMRLGNGHGNGLVHAADRSPALTLCAGTVDPGTGDDDGGLILG